MNKSELSTSAEQELEVPERCKSCPRLGELTVRITQANNNKDYTLGIVESDQAAMLRPYITEDVMRKFPTERYPKMTNEIRAQEIENRIASRLSSDASARNLVRAGQELLRLDGIISSTSEEIETMIAGCPPEGCGA